MFAIVFLFAHAFAEEVEDFEQGIFVGCLIQTDVANAFQKGEVDDAVAVLLVVRHQLVKLVVLLAGEREVAVVLLDELDNGAHQLFGEACLYIR